MALAIVGAVFAFESRENTAEQSAVSEAPPDPYATARQADVQALLDSWARALRSGDTAALAALFDRDAAPGFLDREVRRAQNLRNVPLADFGFDIGTEPETPVPRETVDALQASDVWMPPVYLRYAVTGPDAAPTRKPVALTLARRGETWLLVSDAPVGDRVTWRGPWDFGPLLAKSVPSGNGRTSVVLGHLDDADNVNALAAEVSTAVPAVTELWGTDWARSALVIATSSRDEFVELVGSSYSGSEIAAVSVSDVVRTPPVTGQRVVFSPTAAQRLDDVTRRAVLRHELTHIATRAVTVDGSPMWLLEGFADYSGYRGTGLSLGRIAPTLVAEVDAFGLPVALPSDADFAASATARLAYEQGWAVCAYIAAEFGEPALVALYRALARGPIDEPGVDRVLQEVLGIGTADLVRGWAEWLRPQT